MRAATIGLTLKLLLCICSVAQAQSSPTLKETEAWIIGKVEDYTYKENGAMNSYKVWFARGLMQFRYTTGSGHSSFEDVGTINISDISHISYTHYEKTVWLNIHLKLNRDPDLNTNAFRTINDDGRLSFILRKQFNADKLPNRMRTAFSRLVEMNGGQMLKSEEPY